MVTQTALCVFGWWFVQRQRPEQRLQWLRLRWRVLAAGAIMGIALYPLRNFSIYLSPLVGGAVYVAAIVLLRAIEPEEWQLARHGLLARLKGGHVPDRP